MISRLGIQFFKPAAKAVLETTAYTVGATGVGTAIYQLGTFLNNSIKDPMQNQMNHFIKNQVTPEIPPQLKLGF